MPTALRRLRIQEVSFCRNGANQKAEVKLYKSLDVGEDMQFDLTKITDENVRKMVQDEIARIEALKAESETKLTAEVAKSADLKQKLDTSTEQIAKFNKPPVDPLAGVPESVRKQLNDMETELKIEKSARLDRENEAVVKSLVGSFACDVTAVAKAWKDIPAGAREAMETVLKAAKAQSDKLLEITKQSAGISGSLGASEDASSKLTVIAKSLVETKVCKNMGEAMEKASKDNPELYAEHRANLRK